jgi:hypothetical protein
MSSTRKQQVAKRVLDSIRTRFSKDVSNVWNCIDVRKQLHAPAALGADQDASFTRNHELFRFGLKAWVESLVKITQEWVPRLARIASRDPSLATDDPARWARCCVQEMLGKGLGIFVIGPDAAVPPSFHVKKVRSTIERWIIHVCDNGPDFDRSESGYHEPWRAPVWCQKNFMISFWIKKGRPDRLTVELTEMEVRSAERMFIGRLNYVLGDAEDQARVDLAQGYQQDSHSISSIADGREDSSSGILPPAAMPGNERRPTGFETFAGSLYAAELQKTPNRRVSKDTLLSIADSLDASAFKPPLTYLERKNRDEIGSYNQRVGSKALTTWRKLASHLTYQRAMRRRLVHAAQKVRRHSSALSSATTF